MDNPLVSLHLGSSFDNYELGGIYFDTARHTIKAMSSDGLKDFIGVKSASITDNILTIINENAQSLRLDFSDVASATALSALTEEVNGKYSKPSAGIPKTDLDGSVQESLNKADTAIQDHQTLKTINGNNIAGSGNIGVGTVTEITAGNGLTGGTITGTGTIAVATTIAGSTTVSSVSSIPVTHRAVLATISANANLSFAALPGDGYEVHVIIRNSGSSTISVGLPSTGSYICTSESTIYIAAGKYGEVNVVSIGGTGYVHGINSI